MAELKTRLVESDTTEGQATMAKIDRLMDVVRIGGDDVRLPASPHCMHVCMLEFSLVRGVGNGLSVRAHFHHHLSLLTVAHSPLSLCLTPQHSLTPLLNKGVFAFP